jgi:hypothetical protein
VELSGWAPGPWTIDRLSSASVTGFVIHVEDATGTYSADATVDLSWLATSTRRTTFVNKHVAGFVFESIHVVPAEVASGRLVFTNGGGLIPDGLSFGASDDYFAELGQSTSMAYCCS